MTLNRDFCSLKLCCCFFHLLSQRTMHCLPELWLLTCRMAHPIERLRTKHEEFKHRMVIN